MRPHASLYYEAFSDRAYPSHTHFSISRNMRLSSWRWYGPIPAAFLLQIVGGTLGANGVFASILNDVTLTRALGLWALCTSVGVTTIGIMLHKASDATNNSLPRFMALTGSIGIACQAIMSYALYIHSTPLVYIAACFLGIGCGSIYVVSIVMLQAWIPESPAIATGLGLLFGGGGSLFAIPAFQFACTALGGPLLAMAVVGLLAGAVSACAAMLIEHPPTGWSPLAEQYGVRDSKSSYTSIPVFSEETKSLLSHKECFPPPTNRLSILDILVEPSFTLTSLSILALVGPGFGFLLTFQRMVNTLFGVELHSANNLLSIVTLFGVMGRMAIGFVIDLQTPAGASRYGFEGAKRVNTTLLALQCSALATMPIIVRQGWTNLFSVVTAVIYVCFSGGAVVSACLARSVFSPENSTLAYALLCIAGGIGRTVFSVIVASCVSEEGGEVSSFASRRMFEYDIFVHLSFGVSAIGLISSYFVTPSKAAYQQKSGGPVFVDLKG